MVARTSSQRIEQPEVVAEWLTIAGDPAAWRSIGLTVVEDPASPDVAVVPLLGTSLRVVGSAHDRGIVGWALSGLEGIATGSRFDIDGLSTEVVDPVGPVIGIHELGASGLDHVVVVTDDLVRTSGAVSDATGCPLKRVREVGRMRQGFHRIGRGGLIVEVVERPEVPPGPAAFWGVVIVVDDLDAACAVVGEGRVGDPKDAVQPGRRIATIRDDVGLGLPVALMTP